MIIKYRLDGEYGIADAVNCLPCEIFNEELCCIYYRELLNDLKYSVIEAYDGSFRGAFKFASDAYAFSNLLGCNFSGLFKITDFNKDTFEPVSPVIGKELPESCTLLFKNISPKDSDDLDFVLVAGFLYERYADKYLFHFSDDHDPIYAMVNVDHYDKMRLSNSYYNTWLFM